MLEKELQLEKGLFFLLNGSDSVTWDYFFWLYSGKWTWLPFYLCFLFIFIYRKNWKEGLTVFLLLALVILLCDQIASGIFKPLFHRPRPTHHIDFQDQVKTVLDYRGGKYGFISSHAANAFGSAVFTAMLFRNKIFTATILLFAIFSGYSRIYMGVHFVSDVVAGAFVGAIIGFAVYKMYLFFRNKILKSNKLTLEKLSFSTSGIYGICAAYFIIVLGLFLSAAVLQT
ncbi:MAG: phosphatase PAP2 family protein [Dysgonamonadaceae bacterium]|jgi:undecaprenyl-diphosphatase|nr:phosphatase PAP2 family protein [Dysgonamonadaceae bacterium]